MVVSLQNSISSLGFSNRTTNALIRNGITTVQDLITSSEEELFSMRGIGVAGIEELSAFFEGNTHDDLEIVTSYSFGEYWREVQKDDRNFDMLVDYYNNGLTLQELGDYYNVSRERIRQIIEKGTKRLQDAFENGAIDENIVSSLEQYANNRAEVHTLMIPDPYFSSIGIANLVSCFRPAIYKVLRNTNLNGDWFVRADDNISKIIEILVDELRHRPEPLLISDIENLYSISDGMLMSIKGVIEKDGYVTHEKNRVATGTDRNRIITSYLEGIDRPASMAEIANNTALNESQVRGAICDKASYVNVGKTIYDLVGRQYEGVSIADLAMKILTAEDRALKLDTVIEFIRKYRMVGDLKASVAILNSPNLYQHDDYVLIKGWPLSKIEKKTRNNYYITLEDAILEVINSSDEIFDYEKMGEALKKYNGAVSTNPNSIRATLLCLAEKKLIIRVGGQKSGCYIRKHQGDNTETKSADLRARISLGSFIDANISKKIEIRYQTKRLNSAKHWREISVRGQDSRYIFTDDLNTYGYRVKYLKERVVEYRSLSDGDKKKEPKDTTSSVEHSVTSQYESSLNYCDNNTWYEDVRACVDRLGNTFTLQNVYGFEKELSEKHPDNSNVRPKIRQQLQSMRDKGLIDFIATGVYRKKTSSSDFKKQPSKVNGKIISRLVAGEELNNNEISEIFKVSGQGGMRKSNRTNSLVLIAKHKPDNPYNDNWSSNTIEYTGMGLYGDQSVGYMQNKTLAESKTNGVTVYLFESFTNNRYIYRGIVELAKEPYYEMQKDGFGMDRKVVKFSLRLVEEKDNSERAGGANTNKPKKEHPKAVSKNSSLKVTKKTVHIAKGKPNGNEEKLKEIGVDNILYMVGSLSGASTSLGGAKVYYLDEDENLCFLNDEIELIGNRLTKLEGLPEEYQKKFVYFAGGLGNFGFINKDAVYLGRDDFNWTLAFRFRGHKYEVRSYLPISECPYLEFGEELPMKNYDRENYWKELDDEKDQKAE